MAPIQASSGKVTRVRLDRGGDCQANSALWVIVMARMSADRATRAYVERRVAEGRSKLEVVRVLKRYVARELYRYLMGDMGPRATYLQDVDVAVEKGGAGAETKASHGYVDKGLAYYGRLGSAPHRSRTGLR